MSLLLQPVELDLQGWDLTTKQLNAVEEGLLELEQVLKTPITSLTTEDLEGSGVFDVLMRSVGKHLHQEYDEQRITGGEYATAYLSALSNMMETSVQFLASQQQAHKINADIALNRQKTITELSKTDDNLPIGLGFNHIPKDRTTIPAVPRPVCGPRPPEPPQIDFALSKITANAYGNDGWLELVFDQDVDVVTTGALGLVDSAFTVMFDWWNSENAQPLSNGVLTKIDNRTYTIWFSESGIWGGVIPTLAYSPVADLDFVSVETGVSMEAFAATEIQNGVPAQIDPPTVTSMVIGATGTDITLTFSEDVHVNNYPPNQFIGEGNNDAFVVAITDYSIPTPDTLVLDIDRVILGTDVITLTLYPGPGIRTAAYGAWVEPFRNAPVTNNSAQ